MGICPYGTLTEATPGAPDWRLEPQAEASPMMLATTISAVMAGRQPAGPAAPTTRPPAHIQRQQGAWTADSDTCC